MIDRQRKWELYQAHPDTEPLELPQPHDGLVHPPTKLSPTSRLLSFRDMCAEIVAQRPDHPNWPVFLAHIEVALAWRATIPPEERFWKPDPP